MSRFECSIVGCPFSTDSPLGVRGHARKHRNRFEQTVGRQPEDYSEVRRFFNTDWTPEDFDGQNGQPVPLDAFGGESA